MIDVELSNIWGSVSLPDLLSGEKDLFDAHMQLRTNQPDGPDFLGWLNAPEGVMARAVLSIGKAAERIAELGDTLVIVGSGDAPAAAQAASQMGVDLTALTWGRYFLGNMLPVTLGNLLGGLLVGFGAWYCFLRRSRQA